MREVVHSSVCGSPDAIRVVHFMPLSYPSLHRSKDSGFSAELNTNNFMIAQAISAVAFVKLYFLVKNLTS